MRALAIVNPNSQGGALGRRWPDLAKRVRGHFAFDFSATTQSGDATRLTRSALRDGVELVIAVGGDGTINEVVNGFFENGVNIAPHAALAILPFGTGGDFRRTLGLSNDIESASAVIAKAIESARAGQRPPAIDVGSLEFQTRTGERAQRMFANIASFGISGVVDRHVNSSSKRLGGKLSFLIATLRASMDYHNQRVSMTFDDDPGTARELTIYTCAVANGQYFGGGMRIAPNAALDDGAFDIVALGDFDFADVLRMSPRIYRGSHLESQKVTHRRARTVHVEPLGHERVEIDLDGETPGVLPATFRIHANALRVCRP